MSNLRYTTRDGSTIEVALESEEIILKSKDIVSIDFSQISELENPILVHLDLSHNKMEHVDFSPLAHCRKLRSITISHNELTEVNLVPISGLDIHNLDFNHNHIEKLELCNLPSLLQLSLARNWLETVDLTPLSHSHELETLDLSHNNLESINLSPLAKCKKLRELDLRENQLRLFDFTPIKALYSSKQLNLRFDYEDMYKDEHNLSIEYRTHAGTETIEFPFICTSLWLEGKGITEIDLDQIREFKNITRINLEANHLEELDLSILEEYPNIECLRLGESKLSKLDLTPLSHCKSIAILDLANNGIQDLDLSPLAMCSSLEILIISGNTLQRNIGLTPLVKCQNLTQLFASNCGGLGESFTPSLFKDHEYLTQLNLSGNELSGFDARALGPKPNLEALRLASNAFTSFDFIPLRSFERLKVIDLANNPLSKVDLSPLSSNTPLCVLSLLDTCLKSIDITSLYYVIAGHSAYSDIRLQISSNADENVKIGTKGFSDRREICFLNGEKKQTITYPTVYETEFAIVIDDSVRVTMDKAFKPTSQTEGRRMSESLYDRIDWIPSKSINSITEDEGLQNFGELMHRIGYNPTITAYSILGMNEISAMRDILIDIVKDVNPEVSVNDGIIQLYDRCVDYLSKEIENGRSTIDFDIEELKLTSAAQLVSIIIENRRKEVESIEFEVKDGEVVLEPLIQTFYGGKILKELDIPQRTRITRENLYLIRDEFDKAGIRLKMPRGW
ncbi:MAG: leucine-rich repeat domain-containing protein [Candidatus Thorarchaeota archaeon]